jgi:TPR repeat protein
MTWLGNCYSRGIGVAMDMQAARAWYKKAADAGDEDAQKWLAANPGD